MNSLLNIQPITAEELDRAVKLRDLSDPSHGRHVMQDILAAIETKLTESWSCQCQVHRASPIVSVADNYDNLGYPPGGAARDARYTRYVSDDKLLRTQTSAMIPGVLRSLAQVSPKDVLLVCPGLVYRRDVVDRLHTGEPHQVDLWRIKEGKLSTADLLEMVRHVVAAVLPGCEHRVEPATHPYTTDGLQIDVNVDGNWVEIGECGLAAKPIIAASGLDSERYTGLAMGLGLDRLVMIRKKIDDIRLLRSQDPRIANQMLDMERYVPVSHQPPAKRDISVAIDADLTAEELGDRIRDAMRDHLDSLESVDIISETAYDKLPPQAHARMGMRPGQKNVLLRLTIRDHARTLTSAEANAIRDMVYKTVHKGDRMELASAQSR
jgi:phenylalanyl-tRNA synthetase alpha chain